MFGKNSILKRLTGRSGLAAATFALATALTGTNASAEVTSASLPIRWAHLTRPASP
jgi:hypothetical protein